MSDDAEGNGIATVFGVLFLAVGLLFTFGVWGAFERDRMLLLVGERAQAQVVALDMIRDTLGDSDYLVRYRFSGPGGQVVERQRHLNKSAWRKLKVGGPVTVVYAADDPMRSFPLGGGVTSAGAVGLSLLIGTPLGLAGGALLAVAGLRKVRSLRQRSRP